MDQPTNLNISIKGNVEDVKKAALAAQRRIDLNTRKFKENLYVYGDGSDFEKKMGELTVLDSGTVRYTTEQKSYSCISEKDIKEIAQAIIDVSPNVEAHISAVITITFAEGYDLCVNIDCKDGKMDVDVFESPYDDEDWDEEDEDED